MAHVAEPSAAEHRRRRTAHLREEHSAYEKNRPATKHKHNTDKAAGLRTSHSLPSLTRTSSGTATLLTPWVAQQWVVPAEIRTPDPWDRTFVTSRLTSRNTTSCGGVPASESTYNKQEASHRGPHAAVVLVEDISHVLQHIKLMSSMTSNLSQVAA